MIDTRWFISFRTALYQAVYGIVITDITPARWCMYQKVKTDREYHILYAEEVSPALAAELVHTAGIKTDYFKEIDND